jgi:integrase
MLTVQPTPSPSAGLLPGLATALAALPGGESAAMAGVLKALAFELMARDSQGTRGNSPEGLPENEIDDDANGAANPKGRYAMKVYGPYPHKQKWRILIRTCSSQEAKSYDTEDEAKAALRRFRVEARKQTGIPVEKAIQEYVEQNRRNGLKEGSLVTSRNRLRKIFGPVLGAPLPTITPTRARELFMKLEGSVDSRRNTLAEVKTFCRRAQKNKWIEVVLFEDVQGEGRRHYGKPKLTLDESRRYIATCRKNIESGDRQKSEAGVACAMTLLFGMRASEITDLPVRNLDDNASVIRITRAKSRAGVRNLQVPEWFRPYLATLAAGKAGTDALIGHNRRWLHKRVSVMCIAANVPPVSPHGLRGTHADLALTAAMSPKAVSAALGHETLTTTYQHYADEGISLTADHGRALAALGTGQPN